MKILIVGAGGQVGWELQRQQHPQRELIALGRAELDVCDAECVDRKVAEIRPDWIINASAYTAVDKAESEEALAHQVNAQGAANLAQAAKAHGARLLHISTDFVFDGLQSHPYQPQDTVNPAGVYGASKLAGEQAVSELLADDTLIVRTAWVYSSHGNNFIKTMLRLMSERDALGVIDDQVGTPTWAAELAKVIYLAVDKDLRGIYHWTDTGVASWYDLSVAIYEQGKSTGLIDRKVTINPIPTEAYPLPAQRPAYSVLDKRSLREAVGYTGLHWREALALMLKEMKNV